MTAKVAGARVAVASVVAAVALTLSACSSISSGTITKKIDEPGHTVTSVICHLVGKITICTPYTTYDDEDWRFDLRSGDKTGWVYVSHETFDAYEVGDRYDDKRK